MESEFIIPLCKDDLLCAEEGSYVVDEIMSVRCLPRKITEAIDVLDTYGPFSILGQFDVFFSVVKQFSDVSNQVKFECYQNLHKALLKFMNILITVLEQEDIDRDAKKQHRNTLKMLCYLLTQFTEEFEAEDSKPSTVTASASRGKGKGSKAKKQSTLSFDWSKTKEEFLRVVTQLLQLNVAALWEPPIVEEEFVNIFANCCYKFLENPVVNKDKILRDLILSIIGILVKKYNHSLSVCVKVIQLLQHFEHLIAPMAQLVQVCVVDNGVKNIVVEILREIGQIDPRDLARDTSGTKCYSDFLVELASKIPEHILPNISLLLCHLDGESYSMRNGVLGVMGEVVITRLSQDELDENMKKTRDQILDRLEEHLHDVNAFVRSKSLQIWQNICREKAIPLARQQNLLCLVISRLKDKSSIVRKNAVHLLKEFLMSNPFGGKLPLEEVKKKLKEETEKLKKMAPELTQEQDCEVPVEPSSEELKHWMTLELDIKGVVEEHWEVDDIVDEEGEHVEFQGDVHEALGYALMNIKRQLNNGDYQKALAVLKAAVVTWPDSEIFSATRTEDTTATDQSKDTSEQEETPKNKEETVERELSHLKTIFLNPEYGPVTMPERSSEEREEGHEVFPVSAENGEENPEDPRIVNEVSKQQMVVQYLKDYVSFHTKLQEAILVICQLLGSKTTTDVQEAIEFLVIAHEFGLNNALQGVRRMLLLVWSKDNSIKDAVVEAYERLYLNPSVEGQRARAAITARNLIMLTQGASIGELTSLDELVFKLMKSKLIPPNVIQLLWEKFTMKAAQTTQEESRGALKLLGMLARAQHEIVQSNIDVLVNTGLGERGSDDALLVKDTCTVLLNLNKDNEKVRGDDEPFRFPSDHMIFQRLTDIVVSGITSAFGGMWVPMAEEAVNVIYELAEHPDEICGTLIKNLLVQIFSNQGNDEDDDGNGDKEASEMSAMSCPSHVLARLLALAGHIALRQVVHLDASILGEMKRRERVKEDEKGKKKNKDRSSSSGRRSETVDATPRVKESGNEALEDELGLAGATAEDTETEYIKTICDHEIVTGNNLLSIMSPLIVTVCNNPTKYVDPQLRAAASLALAKFMMVSSEFCEKNLQLLFTILEKSPHAVIRANTIISLGDLTFRFPNLIEPWTPNLYARLRDESCQVRKNTLMVLTHLILNDMVKVKGQISEMATCLEDKDARIADLAKLFFLELSKKGNAVYNILPDVISRLSDPDSGIQEESFRNVLRYLFSFIERDRQCESLVEKLCHRFRATRTERQWRDLSFCLAQLSYNERGVRKLQENFACFHDKLSDDDVYGFFTAIIGKCKKFAKPEMKVVVEELEGRIAACHERGVEDEAGYERANQASAAARVLVGTSLTTPATKKGRNQRGRTPASRRRTPASRPRKYSDADDIPKRKPQTARKSTKKSKKKVIEFDSDDDVSLDMLTEKDWDDVLDDVDSEDDDDDENLNPNILPGKSTQKSNATQSARKRRQLKT